MPVSVADRARRASRRSAVAGEGFARQMLVCVLVPSAIDAGTALIAVDVLRHQEGEDDGLLPHVPNKAPSLSAKGGDSTSFRTTIRRSCSRVMPFKDTPPPTSAAVDG